MYGNKDGGGAVPLSMQPGITTVKDGIEKALPLLRRNARALTASQIACDAADGSIARTTLSTLAAPLASMRAIRGSNSNPQVVS